MTREPMRGEIVTLEEDVGDQCGCHRGNGDHIECEADKNKNRDFIFSSEILGFLVNMPDNDVAVVKHFVIVGPKVIHANFNGAIFPDRVFSP